MCSVIEIKNNDEYYIRYHSPDSMETSAVDKKGIQPQTTSTIKEEAAHSGSDDGTNTTSGDSGHQRDMLSNSPKSQIDEQVINEFVGTRLRKQDSSFNNLKGRNTYKDVDVTSDRGSSEESIIDGKEKVDSSFPEAHTTELVSSNKETRCHSRNIGGPSIEKVPITINSHIPASPERLVNQRTTTYDTGTQMDSINELNVPQFAVKMVKTTSNSPPNSASCNKTSHQDYIEGNKPPENLVKANDENEDNNQRIIKETNLRQRQQGVVMENYTKEFHGNITIDSKHKIGQISSKDDTSRMQEVYSAHEKLNKKLFQSESSTTNSRNKGSSFLGLPMQLQEKQKDVSLISKPKSSIPILVKKEVSSKRKLSSLINSSKCIVDGKDKAIKKENRKNKSNSNDSLEENANKEKIQAEKSR